MSKIIQLEDGEFAVARTPVSSTLLPALPAAMRARMLEGARLQHFADGQLIQQRGDEGSSVWVIEEGAVAVGQFLESGEFRGVAILAPGDSYGELAVLSAQPRIVDAVARGPAALRAIPAPRFERLLMEDPAAMRSLAGALAAQLQEVLNLLAGIRRGTALARTAALLSSLAGGGDGARRIAITQQEIADQLGLTRATANQALAQLERAGLIKRGYGAVEIPVPVRLTGADIA